jgi:hypothetical protein
MQTFFQKRCLKKTTQSVRTFDQNFQIMLTVLAASVFFVLLAFFMFSLRILFVKGGAFRGTCAGNSSFLQKEDIACGVCGRKPGEACGKED